MPNNITINIGGIIRKTPPTNFPRLGDGLIAEGGREGQHFKQQGRFSYTYKNKANHNDARIYYISQKDGKVNPIRHSHTVKNNLSLYKPRNLEGNNPLRVSYNVDLLINDTSSFDTTV